MTSKSGTWFDTKAGNVVHSQPEEGIQLVAPGVEPTPDEQKRVDAYSNPDAKPETVTTKAASK